jgi:hypothetical protein
MKLVFRTLALGRYMQLRRQFSEVEKLINQLNMTQKRELVGIALREFASAAKSPVPHLYASESLERYVPWGNGAELSMQRAKSDNPTLRLRGVATWLAIVYHETKGVKYGEFDGLHRNVMRTLRVLKESLTSDDKRNTMFQVA